MDSSKQDLRVKRTRNAIRHAFEEMVLTEDFDRITVKAVTERAGINRKTFYLHYETIEALYDDILGSILDDFFERYEETPDVPEDIGGHAQRFFLFMAQQPEYVERMVCQPSYYRFGERVYWEQMSRYRAEGNPFRWMPDGQKRLVMRFIRSTALEFYRGWVAEGKGVPKQEASQLVAQLTLDGVRALMR
ncbi:MAG: TetR/AcrR family transcriptional regulator [Coriobacteriia bacterium]|nr:TetR/AcrR family transcriptional regulator [Coriobacteriia bacterium]